MMFLISVQMMALHIPEENRCLDILELIEYKDMLKYVQVQFCYMRLLMMLMISVF
jgi:hypothetical protein